MRVIPVIDDDGESKCSFDARGDQRSGIFRQTMCVEPNTIQDVLYTDMACEEEADRETIPLVRGECTPLPMQGQPMERRPGPGGQGAKGGKGGRDGRGERGDGESGDGRRRLADKELGEDGAPKAPTCDGEFNQGWSWETLKDLWDELTCDTDEAEEGDDVDKNDEDRPQNPCRFLSRNECVRNEQCDMQQNVCVWNNAPDNRRNLYVTYDWQYLMEDGELTKTPFCYSDDLMFTSGVAYQEMCAEADEDTCVAMGCKKWKKPKKAKEGAEGECQAQKSKVKCKKLGDKKDAKNSDAKKALCQMYSLIGCEWSDKKGCTGNANVKVKKN